MLRNFPSPSPANGTVLRSSSPRLRTGFRYNVAKETSTELPAELTPTTAHLTVILPSSNPPPADDVIQAAVLEHVLSDVEQYPLLVSATFLGDCHPDLFQEHPYEAPILATLPANLATATYTNTHGIVRDWHCLGHTSITLGPSHVPFLATTTAKRLNYCVANMAAQDIQKITQISSSVDALAFGGVPPAFHEALITHMARRGPNARPYSLETTSLLLNSHLWNQRLENSASAISVLSVQPPIRAGPSKWDAELVFNANTAKKFSSLVEISLNALYLSPESIAPFSAFLRAAKSLRVLSVGDYRAPHDTLFQYHASVILGAVAQSSIKVLHWGGIPAKHGQLFANRLPNLPCQVISLTFDKENPDDTFHSSALACGALLNRSLGRIDAELAELLPGHTGLSVWTGYSLKSGHTGQWPALTDAQWQEVHDRERINATPSPMVAVSDSKKRKPATDLTMTPWST